MQWPLDWWCDLDIKQVKVLRSSGRSACSLHSLLVQMIPRVFPCHLRQGLEQIIVHRCLSTRWSSLLIWNDDSKWGEINEETDYTFASYFSEALSFSSVSFYLFLMGQLLINSKQYRADVWIIVCHYVCYIVIIYDVCNVIRINLCTYISDSSQWLSNSKWYLTVWVFQMVSESSLLSRVSETQ